MSDSVADNSAAPVSEARIGTRLLTAIQATLTRDQWLAGLLILALANGMARRIFGVLSSTGLVEAVLITFGISAIVWLASLAAISLVLRQDGRDALVPADIAVAAITMLLVLTPFGAPNWWALTGLSAYVMWTSPAGSARRRGAVVFLAITVPMYWGPVIFDVLATLLLRIDALFTALMSGAERSGNAVRFSDGSGYFEIGPPCSSFHNMSLAFAACVAASQFVGQRWSPRMAGWFALATLSVFAVNVSRLALIGLYRAHFDLIHGPIGNGVADWLSICLIGAVCYFGVRRDLAPRA
jgi:exosortase/archaeosortase family protein